MDQDNDPSFDPRTPQQVREDLLLDQITALVQRYDRALEEKHWNQGSVATVIHRQEDMGVVGIICATVCVMCVLILILGAIIFVPDIHDLRAWSDITRKDIARLQALHQQERQK